MELQRPELRFRHQQGRHRCRSQRLRGLLRHSWTLKALDFSKFTGTYKDAENKDAKLTADQFSWTIVDNKTGETVSDLSKKGEYTVVLEADPAKLGYDVNRTRSTFQVTVKQGTIGTADTTFSYNGNVVTALDNLTYDGEDFLSAVNVQVKDDKGNLLKAGQDYVVKAYNSKGKEVKEIVDADNYTIVVTSDSYAFANGKDKEVLNVTVGKINLSKVSFDRAKAPFKTFYSGVDASGKPVVKHSGIPYTGSVIENPVVTFKANDRNGEEKTFVLPSDIYTINWTLGTKRVDALKDAGTYTAQVVLGDKASNYTASGNLTITGTEVKKDMETGFVDVKDEEWFAEALNKAKVNGCLFQAAARPAWSPRPRTSPAPTPWWSSTRWPAARLSPTSTSTTPPSTTRPASPTWTAARTTPTPSPGPRTWTSPTAPTASSAPRTR